MQSPAKEFLFLGGTIATKGSTPHFPTAACSYSFANRHRHTIHDVNLALGKDFTYHEYDVVQPFVQGVQSPIEARDAYSSHVSQLIQDVKRPFVMILQILCCDDRDCQDLGGTPLCTTIVLIAIGFQKIVNH